MDEALFLLIRRFYGVKGRCARARRYCNVRFGFDSAREAAEYMLAECGPLAPGELTFAEQLLPEGEKRKLLRQRGMTIDRINGRRGYEPGNLRYATPAEQLANRRFRSRNQAAWTHAPLGSLGAKSCR